MDNGFQIALPGRLTRTRAADEPMAQVIAADRAERGRRTVDLQAASLLRQAIPGSTVLRAMLKPSGSARLEVVPANRGETPGVVADEPLAGMDAIGVVAPTPQAPIADGRARDHGRLLSQGAEQGDRDSSTAACAAPVPSCTVR